MRICITGGSGFIASYFCDALSSFGHELTLLDLVDPPREYPRARFVQGDIRDPIAVADALDGCDSLLHLAAAHHDFGISRETFFDVNERGARVLCEQMDAASIRRACFFSTVAVYGDAPEPRHEKTTPLPNSPYGESKLAGEKVFRTWTEKGEGRSCLVIRPTVTFGPRNFANMYSLIRQINSGKFLQIGRGDNIKSLSYVENIIDATLFLWEKDGRPAFDVYNWIDKPDLTSRGISKAIYEGLGKKMPGFTVPLWLGIVGGIPFDVLIKLTGRNLPISTARIRKLATQTKFESDKVRAAGFEPRISLVEGIHRMCKWYLAEGQHEQQIMSLPPATPVLRPTRRAVPS